MQKRIDIHSLFSTAKKKASLFLKDRHNLLAVLIVVFALALRLNYAFISGMWVDEGKYSVFGRALLEHPLDYTSRMMPEILDTPPVFPYMLFLSQLVFGPGDAVRIVNPILGSLSVLLIYFIGRHMFSKNVGVIAAALYAVSPISWFYDERVLLETPMTFFCLLTIFAIYYGYEKKNYPVLYASGAFFVFAYLSKQSAAFVFPAILVYLISKNKFEWVKDRRLWIAMLVAFLVMAPWIIRSYSVCGNFSCEGAVKIDYFLKLITKGADSSDIDVVLDPYYYVKLTPYLLTTPILVFSFFGLVPLINGRKKKEYLFLLSFAAIIYIFFSIHAVKDLRFVLLAVPPIILVAAQGLNEVAKGLAGKQLKYIPILAIIILIPLMYTSYSSGKELILNKAPGFLMLKDAGMYLEDAPEGTIIMASPTQPISFYAGDRKMSFFPEKQEDLAETIYNTSTDYVIIDAYERTQRPWIGGYVPYQPYLIGEKVFQQDGQPVVVIFRVDNDLLLEALSNEKMA